MSDLLAPWQPTADDPFDLAKVGHLLRRGGFSASLPTRRELVRAGPLAAVAHLATPVAEAPTSLQQLLAFDDIQRVRAHRVWLVLHGPQQLQLRLSAFWHDHFATSDKKLQDPRAMALQQATFDRFGGGAFDELLAAMCRDPALLRWLDNDVNTKRQPNENFARELFELFTLGRGAYSEADIAAAARAFTGWHVRDGRFHFAAHLHDEGDKQLFGERGPFGGDEVIARTVVRRESAEFLAAKWLRWFVHPEPSREEVDALAAAYIANGRHVGATIQQLLRSQVFFSPRAYRSKVKGPADFVLGTVRSLGGRAKPVRLAATMVSLGEAWLEPPSVEGWHRERAWLSPAAWLLRSNFVADLLADRGYGLQPAPRTLMPQSKRPVDLAKAACLLLLDAVPARATLESLTAVAAAQGDDVDAAAAAVLHAVACLPEYQLL